MDILSLGLFTGSAIVFYQGTKPQTTTTGIIIAVFSILTMYFLYSEKLETGKALGCKPIVSDAKCTKTCFYLSFILLTSSSLYELFPFPYIDAVGSLSISLYAFKEGKEAF